MPNLKNKNILVTGGAGFIGSHLVDDLIAENPGQLVVVDNLFLGRKANLSAAKDRFSDFVFFEGDASDKSVLKRIIEKYRIEVIYNLAVIPLPTSLIRPKWTVDTNLAITTTLCELLKEGAYQTLIHFSSSEAYGSATSIPMDETHPLIPTTPYAASKAADDLIVLSYCRTFDTDAAIVRPFNNYGPRQNDKAYAGVIPIVVNNVLTGRPVQIFGDGEQTRDFIFVKDTVKAAINVYNCQETRSEILNIAGGQEISVNKLVRQILKIMKAENHPVVYTDGRPGEVRRHCGGTLKARKLIDFKPQTALEEGLKITVDWYLSNSKEHQ